MKLLKDTQDQINALPILIRWILYIGIAFGLWETIPWLFDACIVVLAAVLFIWCIVGLSSDSYNALVDSLNVAKEKIVRDLAESLKHDSSKEGES